MSATPKTNLLHQTVDLCNYLGQKVTLTDGSTAILLLVDRKNYATVITGFNKLEIEKIDVPVQEIKTDKRDKVSQPINWGKYLDHLVYVTGMGMCVLNSIDQNGYCLVTKNLHDANPIDDTIDTSRLKEVNDHTPKNQ